MRFSTLASLLAIALLVTGHGAHAAPGAAPYEFLDRLMEAEPLDVPDMPQRRAAGQEPSDSVGFDLLTRETTIQSPMPLPRSGATRAPGARGDLPVALEPLAAPRAVQPLARTDTYGTPWISHVKLFVTFPSGAVGLCSGAMVGRFHVSTAAHCIYTHDANGDGQFGDGAWAQSVRVIPGQTDVVEPMNVADHPVGFSEVTFMRTYNDYLNFADFLYDIALLTLDRPFGDRVGWMGREYGITANALNLNGYPAEAPFVSNRELRQFPSFAGVLDYFFHEIVTDSFTWGGHSGGPVWRHLNGEHWLQGVNSRSDRAGTSVATRLTEQKFRDWEAWMAEDAGVRPPVSRPSLVENVWPGSRKQLHTAQARPGESVVISYNLYNAGFAPTSTVFVDFYASFDRVIVATDARIGTTSFPGLDANQLTNRSMTVTLPANLAPGTYHVGWRMSSARSEYETEDNAAVITTQLLSVLPANPNPNPGPTPPPSCATDLFEPDGGAGSARVISPGFPQMRTLCPAGDRDWAIFAIAEPSQVVVETSGQSGDTILDLFDLSQTPLANDDDSGIDRFSRIERSCGVNELPAGSYYVRVRHFGDNRELDAYTLEVNATPCPSGPGVPPPGPGPALRGPISAKKLKVADVASRPEKRSLKLVSKDRTIVPGAPAGPADPTLVGAVFVLENPVNGERWSSDLPSSGWRRSARGFRFGHPMHPCRAALESGRLKLRCKGSDIGFSLDESSQGELEARLDVSNEPLCMRFANTIVRDEGIGMGRKPTRGRFEVVNAPAPAACMIP